MLKFGEVVNGRWRVTEKIGEGTFSEIYAAREVRTGQKVAVKVESTGSALKQVLEWESNIIKRLQGLPFICMHYWFGFIEKKAVLVMELVGESLSMVRQRAQATGGIPTSEAALLAQQMLQCVKGLHLAGYVHRDIKPSNFVRGLAYGPNASKLYLIDFGLTRQYRMPTGELIPPRPKAEFRGTSMYASLRAHQLLEQGPCDDLWSLFFLLVDMLRGELPWSSEALSKEREAVKALKSHYTMECPEELVEGVRGEKYLLKFCKHLQTLSYENLPDYALLEQIIADLANTQVATQTAALLTAVSTPQHSKRSDAVGVEEWTFKAKEVLIGSHNMLNLTSLIEEAERQESFMSTNAPVQDLMEIQRLIYQLELRVHELHSKPPPSIQTFVEREELEQREREEALQKRREKDKRRRQELAAVTTASAELS